MLVVPKPVRTKGKNKKLDKLLGEEYAEKLAADSVAWYLRPSYSPSDIIIETDGSVKGGTVPALVERLTVHEQTSTLFNLWLWCPALTRAYSGSNVHRSFLDDFQVVHDRLGARGSAHCEISYTAPRRPQAGGDE